jgi:hypothetical protein
MISSGDWLTPTRASGVVAYGLALICSGVAWTKSRPNPRVSRIAASLTAIEGLFLLDIIFNGRWLLHNWIGSLALSHNAYQLRRLPQFLADVLLLAVFLFVTVYILRRFRAMPGILMAIGGATLSIIVWCVEVVSLHQVDVILYLTLGPFMVVSYLWLLASLATSIGILFAAFEQKTP